MLKTHGTKYSRMDQVKFVEDKKKLLGPFVNTLAHMLITDSS